MYYFTQDFIEFFKELSYNNNKDWFDINRKRYEQNVKNPFLNFVQDLIDEFRTLYPDIERDAKNCVFRINKDIRFSKDKSPYKLFTSALISPNGKKNSTQPGFYIEFNPESISIYGGIYMPDNKQIGIIRNYILENDVEFNQIIEEKNFKSHFNEILGEKSIRISKEFKTFGKIQPLIFNKQWYVHANLDAKTLLDKNLLNQILAYFNAALPFHLYIKNAINT